MAGDAGDSTTKGDDTIRDRVQELTWEMVDGDIAADEFRLLENLLLSDDGARDTYIACMQLHADLADHFSKGAQSPAGATPVVSVLGDAMPPISFQPPVSEPN